MVGPSRCDVPARAAAGGTNVERSPQVRPIAPLCAARSAQRAIPTQHGFSRRGMTMGTKAITFWQQLFSMKRMLHVLALLIAVVGVGLWLGNGRNTGWTKTSRPIQHLDPVTEIAFTEYEKGFFPGVDFLGATVLASLGLFGISFLVRKKI
jgi:hypothetical protein